MENARRESVRCPAAVIRSAIELHRLTRRESQVLPAAAAPHLHGVREFDGAASTRRCDRLASHSDALASAGNIFSRIIREVTGPANRSATLPLPSTTNVSGIP